MMNTHIMLTAHVPFLTASRAYSTWSIVYEMTRLPDNY